MWSASVESQNILVKVVEIATPKALSRGARQPPILDDNAKSKSQGTLTIRAPVT